MKVILIGNYANDRQESMQRAASLFFEGLRKAGVDVELMVPPAVFGRLKPSAYGLGKWLGYIDKFLLFPRMLRRRISELRGDNGENVVVHICDHSNAFYTKHLQDTPHVVTCHDLFAVRSALGEIPQNPTRWSGRRLQEMILNGLNHAQHVISISKATDDDLLRLSTLKREQVSVVPMALNYPYSPMPQLEARKRTAELVRSAGGDETRFSEGFLLHVGGNQWYKNRMGVLGIYAKLKAARKDAPLLVMAGKPFTQEMIEFVNRHGLADRVISIQSCDNESLRALYSTALALLFPSLAEGFGWPVIEAQACGCPVASSDIDPVRDVSGRAAILHAPDDEEGFAVELLKLSNPGERERLIQAGLENAKRYEPAVMIGRYLAIYEALIADRTPAMIAKQQTPEGK